MRSKTEWDISQTDTNDKVNPVKIGATSIQAYGIDYEFDIVGELNQQHVFHISKSRCFELQDTSWVKPGIELGNV